MFGLDKDGTKDPHILAGDITRRSASNFWFVGQALSSRKRKLFEAAYASMRVIDDFVDNEFLALSKEERAVQRDSALSRVDAWLAGAETALQKSTPVGTGLPKREALLFTALREASAGTNLPAQPWADLAAAMRFDVNESPLLTWRSFETYCKGASVAPASVFLYVLLAREDGDRLTSFYGPETIADFARDMAVFCYLVHIVRDFSRDVIRGGQLLTIPREAIAIAELTVDDIVHDPICARPVLFDLVQRATVRRDLARDMANRIARELGPQEAIILNCLLSIYERLHDLLLNDPMSLGGGREVTDRLRVELVEQLGLSS